MMHDTVYRRVRRGTISQLHKFDDALSRAGRSKRRVLFEAVSPMSFAVFQPIYQRLQRDPRVELWFTAHGSVWQPADIYTPLGIRENVVPSSVALRMKVDAYINADLWDMTWLRRRTRRIHLFHGVAGKYGLDAPVDLAPTISTFDCLMFANVDRRRRYIDAAIVPDDEVKAALVGYPKTDRLVDGSIDEDQVMSALGLDARLPTVIYAPTWSPYSSLNAMGEEVIDRLAAEGLQVLVKLHDRSYDLRERGGGGVDWAARLSRYDSHPRVRVIREGDGAPYMVASNAMITDHSSIGFEFMLLDRPLVVIDRPELIAQAAISDDKVERLRAGAEVTTDSAADNGCRRTRPAFSRHTVGSAPQDGARAVLSSRHRNRSRGRAALPVAEAPATGATADRGGAGPQIGGYRLMATAPSVSILICTYQRAALLEETLAALGATTVPDALRRRVDRRRQQLVRQHRRRRSAVLGACTLAGEVHDGSVAGEKLRAQSRHFPGAGRHHRTDR